MMSGLGSTYVCDAFVASGIIKTIAFSNGEKCVYFTRRACFCGILQSPIVIVLGFGDFQVAFASSRF